MKKTETPKNAASKGLKKEGECYESTIIYNELPETFYK